MPQPKTDEWEVIEDDSWEPVTEAIPIPASKKNDSTFLSSFWESANKPLVDVSPTGRAFAESMSQPSLAESESYWLPRIKGFVGGVGEGLSDVVSSLTSPLNLATMAATGGASGLASRLPTVAKGLSRVGQGLSLPVMAHGASAVADPDATMGERLFGVTELAGGAAGIKGVKPKARVTPKISSFADEVIPEAKAASVPEVVPEATVPAIPEVVSEVAPAKVADPEVSDILKKFGVANEEAIPELSTRKPVALPDEVIPESLPKSKVTEQRVVYDQAGNKRVLSEIDAVDYEVQPGETYGIEKSNGMFIKLNDLGGTVPENLRTIRPRRREYPGLVKPKTTTDKTLALDLEASLSERLNSVSENPPSQDVIPAEINNVSKLAQAVKEVAPEDKPGLIRRALGLNKALLTSWDLSAPGRQGKSFILNKSWWTSLDDMVKAWGSKEAADNIHQSIIEHPSGYFKPVDTKTGKSFAENVGLDLADNEEVFNTVLGKKVREYLGVTRSSRAHTAFLNKLRSDQFASFMDQSKKAGFKPEENLQLARSYADFINSATGRGSLDFGSLKLERSAGVLSDIFFAPRNMSGQIRTWNAVLNPVSYYQMDPVLRQQALRSLFAIAGTGLAVGELARVGGAKVSNDPTSADFRKIRFGDTRIDPFGGYQQFPVAAMRLLTGTSTSSVSGKTYDLTSGRYGRSTRKSVAERFFINRLAPLPSFVYAWLDNKDFDGKPFEAKKALFERVFPIAASDIIELAQEDPALAGILAVPTTLGLTGSQVYTRE